MTVRFEFVGGLMDGQTLSNASLDASESRRAACYYSMTDKGKVGAQFPIALEAGVMKVGAEAYSPMLFARSRDNKPYYEVEERHDLDGAVHLRVAFIGRGKKTEDGFRAV